MRTVSAKQLGEDLKVLYELDRPAMIWGGPGIGKSSIPNQIAEEKKIGFCDLRLLLFDPIDLRGLPSMGNKLSILIKPSDVSEINMKELTCLSNETTYTIWAPPKLLPFENNSEFQEEGILFFDEISAASPLVQNSALQPILDKRIGEFRLKSKWRRWAAGNRVEDKSHTYRMGSALRSRFVQFILEPDYKSWKEWALRNNIHPFVISFLGFMENRGRSLLYRLADGEDAFPNPRSYEFLSQILFVNSNPSFSLIQGCIGEGAAVEFQTYCKVFSQIPDPDEILAGKDIIPEEASQFFALEGMLVQRYREENEYGNRLLAYSLSFPEKFVEFAVLLILDCIKINPEGIVKAANWNKWQKIFKEVII